MHLIHVKCSTSLASYLQLLSTQCSTESQSLVCSRIPGYWNLYIVFYVMQHVQFRPFCLYINPSAHLTMQPCYATSSIPYHSVNSLRVLSLRNPQARHLARSNRSILPVGPSSLLLFCHGNEVALNRKTADTF